MKRMALLGLFFVLSACVTVTLPPFVDRHSVMESEAAGEWPQLENAFLEPALKPGPAPLAQEGESKRKKKVYKVIMSDMHSQASKSR